jgi:hypothetical protein
MITTIAAATTTSVEPYRLQLWSLSMPRRSRPTAATVVAVFNLIIGIPCFCCMGASIGFEASGLADQQAAAPPPPNAGNNALQGLMKMAKEAKEQQDFVAREVPSLKTALIANSIIVLIYALALTMSAIGLLKGQPFARTLCLGASTVMLLTVAGTTVFSAVMVLPAQKKFQEKKQAEGNPVEVGNGIVEIAVRLLVRGSYPALAIALLMTGSVRAYYGGGRIDAEDQNAADRGEVEYDRRLDDDYYR